MISLRRIDHVSLRVTDVEDAARRWCAQFGLMERERDDRKARLACDDEPFSLELVAAEAPGIGHVAYELRRSCPLDDARRHFEELGVDYEERDGGLEVVDPEGNQRARPALQGAGVALDGARAAGEGSGRSGIRASSGT